MNLDRSLLFSSLLLSTACTGTPRAVPAPRPSDPSGAYLKAFGGAGLLEDDEVLYTPEGGSPLEGEGEFDAGFLAGLAVGYRFDESWAVEAEYTYRTNDVSSFESSGSERANGGDFASTALMLNAFYHFATDWRFDPYLGLGFGTATEIDIDLSGPGFDGEESFSGSSPAAQYMVGAQGPVTDDLDLFVEGRFFRAFDPDMDGEGTNGNVESEYGHYALLFGLSWGF